MKKMRTMMVLTLAVIMCLSLAACSKGDINSDGDIMEQDQSTGDITESTTTHDTVQFKGVIDSIDGDEAIVTPDEGEDIRRSAAMPLRFILPITASHSK